MAYDDELADRIRTILADETGLTEKKMFGGLGFMLDGHMAVAANSSGGLMVRVDPATGRALADGEAITPMHMNGRTMSGWLSVDTTRLESDERLAELVQYGIDYVRSLPPK